MTKFTTSFPPCPSNTPNNMLFVSPRKLSIIKYPFTIKLKNI